MGENHCCCCPCPFPQTSWTLGVLGLGGYFFSSGSISTPFGVTCFADAEPCSIFGDSTTGRFLLEGGCPTWGYENGEWEGIRPIQEAYFGSCPAPPCDQLAATNSDGADIYNGGQTWMLNYLCQQATQQAQWVLSSRIFAVGQTKGAILTASISYSSPFFPANNPPAPFFTTFSTGGCTQCTGNPSDIFLT